MTRTAFFAALGLLACGIVFGAPRPETTTYVDGNVAALKPNTGGTLVFTDKSSLVLRTGLAEVSVPYSGIRKAELGATQVHSHDAPAYKVWTRLHKTETQLLTLEYLNAQNEANVMTLELAKPIASNVLATIKEHTAPANTAKADDPSKGKKSDPAWWGDSYWKTNRNAEKWDAATSAPAGSK
jgi:hypothetical protein